MSKKQSDNKVTLLLMAHRRGEEDASERLFAVVYKELHTMAHRQLLALRPWKSINTTGLIHETYLKLFGRTQGSWEDRVHFFAVTARAMRQVLIDHSRRNQARKRVRPKTEATVRASGSHCEDQVIDVIDLDLALRDLAKHNARLSTIVELRFFGGLSTEEIARALGISVRTVSRDWVKAKAILYLKLKEPDP